MTTTKPHITFERLSSGYWHIRGGGPCEWAQPPCLPCSEETLRAHAFPQASDYFIRETLRAMHLVKGPQ